LTRAGDSWIASLSRHWYLDWEGPRPESLTQAATEMILREEEAAADMRAGADAARDVNGDAAVQPDDPPGK
jgi:hypothetical protein